MKRYLIEDAKCGVTAGGMACGPVPGNVVVTIKYNDGTESGWFNIVEVLGIPNYFLTDKDIYDDLIEENLEDEEFNEYLEEHSISSFNGLDVGEYSDVFCSISEDPENPAIPLIRYAIALVRCSMEELEELIEMGRGKYADELDVPASDLEEEYKEENEEEYEEEDDADNENSVDSEELLSNIQDKKSLYRVRLMLESQVNLSSVYKDIDNSIQNHLETLLQAVLSKCEDENDFQTWKKTYIAAEYEKLRGKKFITCSYVFAGIGQYKQTMPVEKKESFICWIDGNGSAFFGEEKEATEEEVKEYISLMAGSDILKR